VFNWVIKPLSLTPWLYTPIKLSCLFIKCYKVRCSFTILSTGVNFVNLSPFWFQVPLNYFKLIPWPFQAWLLLLQVQPEPFLLVTQPVVRGQKLGGKEKKQKWKISERFFCFLTPLQMDNCTDLYYFICHWTTPACITFSLGLLQLRRNQNCR